MSKFSDFKSQFIEMFGGCKRETLESLSQGWLKGQSFKKEYMVSDGTNECIHYGELFTKYGPIIHVVHSKTNEIIKMSSNKGDILFPASDVTPNGLARCSMIDKEGVLLGGDIIILRPNNKLNNAYMSYAINNEKEQLFSIVTGSVVKHISAKGLRNIAIPIPSIEEQIRFVSISQQADKSKFELKQCIENIDKVIKSLING